MSKKAHLEYTWKRGFLILPVLLLALGLLVPSARALESRTGERSSLDRILASLRVSKRRKIIKDVAGRRAAPYWAGTPAVDYRYVRP